MKEMLKGSSTKGIAAIGAYEGAEKLYERAKHFLNSKFTYNVTVAERDLLYDDVHKWLMTIMPNEKHRALSVSTVVGSHSKGMEISESDEDEPRSLIVRYNDDRPRTVNIDGHRVTVHVQASETKTTSLSIEPDPDKIHFSTRTYEAQQAVIKHLHRLNDQRSTSRKAVLRMVSQWGSWRTRSDLPPRTLASVSLPVDQKKRIVSDLEDFLGAEDHYNRLAISWHRGYMLKGPSGTGKTSLVKALANHFNLDLWYISLSDLKAEASLLGLLAEVSPRSILLLEDIDTMRITHDRDDSEQGTINMSSLLNTLDGVATPHGLITMMTTNRFEILDEALTRAGRMDLIEEIGWPTTDTINEMFQHFYKTNVAFAASQERLNGISTAEIAEILKHNMHDAWVARAAVTALVNERHPVAIPAFDRQVIGSSYPYRD